METLFFRCSQMHFLINLLYLSKTSCITMAEVNETVKPEREDLYSGGSEKKGVGGLFESFIRRFRGVSFMIALGTLYFLVLLSMGISTTPAVYLFMYVSEATSELLQFVHYLAIACSIVFGFFLYGLSMIFVVPFFNFIMPFRVKPFRGNYFSLASIPWYFHNAFIYVVRYTFLEYFTPTPLNILFYKLMGMKIGKHSHINTTNISDAALIEIGDRVTIG
jgi:hypothetical protein